MAEHESGSGGGDAKKGFFTFLFILAVLGFAWFETGGPERASSRGGLFLNPPAPLGGGGSYGLSFLDNVAHTGNAQVGNPSYSGTTAQFQAQIESLQSPGLASPYKGQVSFIRTTQGLGVSDAQAEYVVIEASNGGGAINITGWSVESVVTHTEAKIGDGTRLLYSGRENFPGPIILNPGEHAVISSGRSPVGSSFHTNMCSGYLEQFQNYVPDMPHTCPLAQQEVLSYHGTLEDVCVNYLTRLPQCSAPIMTSPPPGLSNACNEFIAKTLNYNSCVDNHKNDSSFYGNEWRIYLNRTYALWKQQRETLVLLDQNGKTVDLYSYNY